MRIVIVLILLLIAGLSFASASVLPYQVFQTQSGLKVYFMSESTLPMLDLRLVFDAGSTRDGQEYGLAKLTSDFIGQGSKTWTADQIADAFDDRGGVFGASVNKDMTILSLRSLSDDNDLKANLDTFLKMSANLNIRSNTFERVLNQALAAIKVSNSQPRFLAKQAFYKDLYTGPYAHPVIGSYSSVSAITAPDVMSFYRQYYVTRNAVLVLVGNITLAQAKSIAERVGEAFPAGVKAPAVQAQININPQMSVHVPLPSEQTTILMGSIATAQKDPRNLALSLVNVLLGGDSALSVLYDQIREQNGLAYSVYSHFSRYAGTGVFYLISQTQTNQASQTIQLLNQVLAEFTGSALPQSTFKNAQSYLKGHFPLLFDSNAGIANLLVQIGFYHLPRSMIETYLVRVSQLKNSAALKTFNSVVNLNQLVTVTVGQNE